MNDCGACLVLRVAGGCIDHATGRLLGSGGFADPPVGRAVEIGYEVAPKFRGRRFGAAAARALFERAVASGEVDHVIAHTLPGPNASTGVLVSMGSLAGRVAPGGDQLDTSSALTRPLPAKFNRSE
jgi:RimJ/RimL family protein N-acetyltransferase